jgi:ABC-type transport system involved in cytochrome bd biosynthesis fused ATPase/permease subunit
MENKIEYKKAFKKQIVTLIAAFIVFFMLIYLAMQPSTGALQFGVIGLLSLVSMFAVLKTFRNQAKEAKCPHCKTDLFEIIQVALYEKVEFNYCPTCGKNVEL